ncbi:hypothetical protein M409DRAFT_71274 [Zasmidium cellare ATCC 36951]|uniref:Fumarylacetoacetase-like C-terminal domain-containing protein n=1 Tax=Zasmidium cellare ATCC 36951 TaxID=1080233 RepID=A0A6A6C0D0_ZASCE|nr:uncharacterized protein M409DRAFT_71274 [Zasmidium cellare ATCC 36951]KAF2159156.1 hypothetical protein M409DRAFT_71274 [Zasmidium cellare ATCC 36951]
MASLRPRRRWYANTNDIEGMLNEKSLWETIDPSIRKLAVFSEHARAHNYQIPMLSKSQHGTFDQARAYQVAAAIRQLREMNGDVVAGRKLGFTNKQLWPEYGVDESNWSYVYENTVLDLPEKGELSEGKVVLADISHLSAVEPKIEPEIVFGLKETIDPSMSDLQLLECIDWLAHGFEIVISIYPHWRFTAADATAAFALHGLLLVGPRKWLQKEGPPNEQLVESLKKFTVELHQNGEKVDTGSGTNVLGSPINALRHLAEMLAKDEVNKPLEAGEVVTTGTLTRALTINNNDHWSTKIDGIDLPGLDVTFKLH